MGKLDKTWCGDGKAEALLLKLEFPGADKKIVNHADKIISGSFVFQDLWEMERTSVPVVFSDSIDWQFQPYDDPEWTYALNRHSFFPALCKAYAISGKACYAQRAAALIDDWIKNVPLSDMSKKTAWRPIEAGIRCEAWLSGMPMIRGCASLPEGFFDRVDACLRTHADYLAVSHGGFQRLSNWGILQDRGLFLLGIYFNEQSYIDLSLNRLNDNISLQVLPDGIHWEQSPQYHVEVMRSLLTVIQAAARCGIPLPDGFSKTVLGMARALALWIKPNGHLLCQSDSDDVDARGVLAWTGYLCQAPELMSFSQGTAFEENLWGLGIDAFKEINSTKGGIKLNSTAFIDSGNYIIRDKNNFLHMHCGSLGSGHGHADLLHIDLFAHGEDILTDSGRYHYPNSSLRHTMKSPAAHNTFTVDGKDFTEYASSWDYTSIAQPVKGEYRFLKDACFISGGHLGYWRKGIFVFRKVIYLAPGLYIIFDEIYATGTHTCEQYFHFNNHGTAELSGGSVKYQGKSASAMLLPLAENAEKKLIKTPLSRTYNELEYGSCLKVAAVIEGFACLATVIATDAASQEINLSARMLPVTLTKTGETLPGEKAHAVRISLNGDDFTVICLHEEVIAEVGFVAAGGHAGYGKLLAFTPEIPAGICLAW
ncbi:MAG: heparinase II/III family protein [Clostridiales bacterium]|jgi:hypothetical protein|nr:heparinase II/III family protein [Clostridiales bacterium]